MKKSHKKEFWISELTYFTSITYCKYVRFFYRYRRIVRGILLIFFNFSVFVFVFVFYFNQIKRPILPVSRAELHHSIAVAVATKVSQSGGRGHHGVGVRHRTVRD